MLFKLKNIGKIAEAEIKLDGITVICGDNNTGKSTVGKALYLFYKSLYNYKGTIIESKCSSIKDYLDKSGKLSPALINLPSYTSSLLNKIEYVTNDLSDEINVQEIMVAFRQEFMINLTKSNADDIRKIIMTSDEDILNEYVFRHFESIMNGQVKNLNNIRSKSVLRAEFYNSSKIDNIDFYKEKCIYNQNEPITHQAYYINNPFVIDKLNQWNASLSSDDLETNVVAAIRDAQDRIEKDKTTNLINVVSNKKELEELKKLLKKTYTGDTVIKDGRLYYSENGTDIDIRNISTGLKAFALIERMLTLGVLNKEDVLILDEPEIHLHSEWQIKYAELIVELQKRFELTILIVTHSFQFLEALNFFMQEKGIADKGNYYTPEISEKGAVLIPGENNLKKIKKNLKSGMFTLADMQLEALSNGEDDEEDNK